MTPQPPPAERSLADILADTEAEANERPVVEPFVLRLHSGKTCAFRDPNNITSDEWVRADRMEILKGKLWVLCATDADFKRLWAEVGDKPPNRIEALASAVNDYYEQAGKAAASSTPSKPT